MSEEASQRVHDAEERLRMAMLRSDVAGSLRHAREWSLAPTRQVVAGQSGAVEP